MGGKLGEQAASTKWNKVGSRKFLNAAKQAHLRDTGILQAASRSISPPGPYLTRDIDYQPGATAEKLHQKIDSVSRSLNVPSPDQKNIKAAFQKVTERTQSRSPAASNIKMHINIPEGSNIRNREEKLMTSNFFQKSFKNYQSKKRNNLMFNQMNFTGSSIKNNTKVSTPKSQTDLSLLRDNPPSDNEYQLKKPVHRQHTDTDHPRKAPLAFHIDAAELQASPALQKQGKYALDSPAEGVAACESHKLDLNKFKNIRTEAAQTTHAKK